MAKTTPRVEITPDENVPTEILAEAIQRLSISAEKLLTSGLTKHALALLLKDATSVPIYQIELVLDALPDLARRYTGAKKRGK